MPVAPVGPVAPVAPEGKPVPTQLPFSSITSMAPTASPFCTTNFELFVATVYLLDSGIFIIFIIYYTAIAYLIYFKLVIACTGVNLNSILPEPVHDKFVINDIDAFVSSESAS